MNKFHERIKKSRATYDRFITELRNLSASCEFGNTIEVLRDLFALNTKNTRVKQTIMNEAFTRYSYGI